MVNGPPVQRHVGEAQGSAVDPNTLKILMGVISVPARKDRTKIATMMSA